jgi:gamma-glutamylcyclotransferase (GGCT)/AIG2-like uncharacterized protein YtfP
MASAAIGLKREAKDLMTHRLFVYGTLMPGEINAGLLEPLRGSWQRARVQGALGPQGWSAPQDFPALVPSDGRARVPRFALRTQWRTIGPAYA